MFSFASIFASSTLIFGLVSASPLERRQESSSMNCSPNFEGTGVSVTNSALEWGVAEFFAGAHVTSAGNGGSLTKADFRFEQTGSPATSYVIKTIDNNNLGVGLHGDHLQLEKQDSSDLTQIWNVKCDFCSDNISQSKGGAVAYGCNVTSATNGKCATVGKEETDALFLADCDGGDLQNFDFWTKVTYAEVDERRI